MGVKNAHDSREWTADQQVRNDSQNGRDDYHLPQIYPAIDDQLVNHVKHDRDDEHLSHISPHLRQQRTTAGGVCKDRPEEIGRPAFAGVPQAGTDCEGGCDGRLEDQAKGERPVGTTDEQLPNPREEFVNRHSPSAGRRSWLAALACHGQLPSISTANDQLKMVRTSTSRPSTATLAASAPTPRSVSRQPQPAVPIPATGAYPVVVCNFRKLPARSGERDSGLFRASAKRRRRRRR